MDGKPLFTIAKWVAGIVAGALVLSLLAPVKSRISARGNISIGISNCRQVITAMRIYAADHDGKYPKGRTANEVFRELFKAEILDWEHNFHCPISPYEPDNDIGAAPDFSEAVKYGENHWAMTKGLTDGSEGSIPLVYESPLLVEWPPKWTPDAAGKAVKGRSWSGGKIIIGLNNSSVSLQNLAAKSGPPVTLAPIKGEKLNLFEMAIDPVHFPKGEVLDVE